MRLRRYAVTVMDNWTPTREFWTLRGAVRHFWRHQIQTAIYCHLFLWDDNLGWDEVPFHKIPKSN